MNPLLMELLKRAQEPMVGETGAEQALTEPSLDQSPTMARIKGFGAGAIEGARSLTSPLSLALTAIPGGRAGKAAVGAAKGLAGVTPELVQAGRAVKQVMPEADDVTRLAAQLKQRLTQVPTSASKMPSMPGEFTHMGNVRPNPNLRAIAEQGTQNVGLSPMRRTLQSQTGEVNPNLVLGGGAALGGGLLAKKLYDAIQGLKTNAQTLNPLNRASGILDEAGE